jgi:hypothetical protein
MVLMPGICVRDFRLMSLMRVTVVMSRAVVDIRGGRFVVNVPNARLFVETRSRSGAERKGCARREHAKQIKQRDQAPCPFPFRFGQFQEHSARAFDATTVPGKRGSAKCLVLCNRRWPSVLPPKRHPASILSPRSLVFTAAFIVTATVAVVQRDRSVSYAGSPCKLWMRTSVSPLPPISDERASLRFRFAIHLNRRNVRLTTAEHPQSPKFDGQSVVSFDFAFSRELRNIFERIGSAADEERALLLRRSAMMPLRAARRYRQNCDGNDLTLCLVRVGSRRLLPEARPKSLVLLLQSPR